MPQPCKKCGYESPEADKFCRQCGGQLPTESEFTSAATLNQGRVEPNPQMAGIGTGRFAPSIGDVVAGETERYYYPPQYAPVPVYNVQPADLAPPKPVPFSWLKSLSGFVKGAALFILFAGLLAATAGAVFFAQQAEMERHRRYEAENRGRNRFGNNADGRAQDAWSQMEETLKLIDQAAETAAGAGGTLLADSEKPPDLSKYAYPGARVEAMIRGQGKEALSMLSQEDSDTVRAFYEKQFGKPVIQVGDPSQNPPSRGNRRMKLLFQPSTSPSVLIKVEELDRNQQVRITILRSILRFPQER